MKKLILICAFIFITIVGASAQKKFTYSYICTNARTETPVVTWIDFYKGYIKVLNLRYNFAYINSDGDSVYENDRGNKYIISPDYSEVWEIQKFLLFNQMSQITNHYKYIGKGSQPAIDILNGKR